MARSFSASDRPRRFRKASYIWKAKSFLSAKLRIGSTYFTLISAKTLFSFVKAAFTVAGVAVTVGQALVPVSLTSGECSTSTMGKKMASRGFLRCFTWIRLYTWEMPIFAGKQEIGRAHV